MEEGPKANPRRVAMENYGARLDVHDLLSRFMTDLLCAQPDSSKHEGLLSHGCKTKQLKPFNKTFPLVDCNTYS